jgi:hypothetical protein
MYILYFLLRERAMTRPPLVNTLTPLLVKKSAIFSQFDPEHFIKFFTKKNIFPRLI